MLQKKQEINKRNHTKWWKISALGVVFAWSGFSSHWGFCRGATRMARWTSE